MPNFDQFSPLENKIPVAILGATGTVGQRFIQLLENHPWFEITVVAGSERSRGQVYKDIVNWLLPSDLPAHVGDLVIQPIEPNLPVKLVFSALPTKYALELEPKFAAAGYVVVSNAAAFRQTADIPLLIPEINAHHLSLIEQQQSNRGWDGFIVTSPNCSTTGIALPLQPLDDEFGVETIFTTTMQAISGAGYPGVAAFDITNNLYPYIQGEEEKIETETKILLGDVGKEGKELHTLNISAQSNRVNIIDGHTASISLKLKSQTSEEEILKVWNEFNANASKNKLPSSPESILEVLAPVGRPQPRLDVDRGEGMTVSVGQLRKCPVLDFKITTLVHNTVRGAAGGAILNAELLVNNGLVE